MQNNIIEPKCKIIKFPDGFECMGHIVFVEGEDYDLALHGIGEKSWLDEKIKNDPNFYNEGILKDGELSPIQVGRFGEHAFELMTGLKKDWSYKKNGDDEDFKIWKWSIDVKTQAAKYSQHKCYVMGNTYRGYTKKLKSNIFVFCFTDKDYQDHEKKIVPICFVGWQTRDFILSKPLEKAFNKESKHKNYYLKYSELGPMDVLLKNIKKI